MSPSEELQREIRAARPAAPAELRERVRLVVAEEPVRKPSLAQRAAGRLSPRRFLLVAAPATLIVAIVAAGVIGLTRPGSPDETVVSGGGESGAAMRDSDEALESASPESTTPPGAGTDAIAPDPGRLQRIDAELSLRVEDVQELSRATQEAMRIARSLGGHVASVSYDAHDGGSGSAQIALRVPTARVQTAVVQLSGLGTILGQRFGIQDLQETVDDLARQISETEQRIAQLQSQLGRPNLTDDERAALRVQLDEARRLLAELRRGRDATRAEARFATINVGLTTEEILGVPEEEGALDRVVDILRWEALAVLYVLVVAGPIVLLGALVWLALRLRRRRAEARLLEQN